MTELILNVGYYFCNMQSSSKDTVNIFTQAI